MGLYSLKDDAMPVFLLEILDTKTICNCQKMTVKNNSFLNSCRKTKTKDKNVNLMKKLSSKKKNFFYKIQF